MGNRKSFLAGKQKNKNTAAKKATQRNKTPSKGTDTAHSSKRPPERKKTGSHGHAGFVRAECYGRRPSNNTTGQRLNTAQTYGAVLREAYREKGYHKHVNAQDTLNNPPRLLWVNPEICPSDATAQTFGKNLEQYVNHRLDTGYKITRQRNRGSQKFTYREIPIPKNQAALVAGVASLPRELWDSRGKEWEKRTLEWLQQEYPDGQLKGVVLHNDEAHPHVHFYAVSNEPDCDAKLLAAGYREKKLAKEAKKGKAKPSKTSLDAAYKEGMKRFQDSYFEAVSEPLGMKRLANRGFGRLPRQHFILTKIIERERIWNTKRELELTRSEGKLLESQRILSEHWENYRAEADKFQNKLDELISGATGFKGFLNWKKAVSNLQKERDKKLLPWKEGLQKRQAKLDSWQLDIESKHRKLTARRQAAARVYWEAKRQIKLGLPYDVSAQRKQAEYEKLIAEQKQELAFLQNENKEQSHQIDQAQNAYEWLNEFIKAGNGDPSRALKWTRAMQKVHAEAREEWQLRNRHERITEKIWERQLSGKGMTPQQFHELCEILAQKLIKIFREAINPEQTKRNEQIARQEIDDEMKFS